MISTRSNKLLKLELEISSLPLRASSVHSSWMCDQLRNGVRIIWKARFICLVPVARPHRRIIQKGAFNRPMRKRIPKLARGQSA